MRGFRTLRRWSILSISAALGIVLLSALIASAGASPGIAASTARLRPQAPVASSTATPRLTANTKAPCNGHPNERGTAHCLAVIRTPSTHALVAQSAPPPTALSPADIQSAYSLPDAGSGQTVAIIDAFGDSNAESDLATFRSQYSLPPCTTANGCFTKVNQQGQQGDYPADDSGWGLETSLDLDAVSSACPKCNILLVEGNTNGDSDLQAAEQEAVDLGAKFISNSWGEGEFAGEQFSNSAFDHPGVAVTASSGDTGNATIFPSTDPNVVAVGGTTLTRDSNVARGWDEAAWSSGGSGCSPFEPQPDYQAGIATNCPSNRATADVSADADPESGLATYDTLGFGGWLQVGGTSLASPLVAAMYALAGTPQPGTFPVTYPYHDAHLSSDMFDVVSGTNGSCGNVLCQAGPGWDGPTGLGTPDGVGAFAGAPQGVIQGRVTDAVTGDPIAGALVSANTGNNVTRTDSSGHYSLDIAVGTYDLTASKYAYQSSAQTGVTVTKGQTTTANFTLKAAPSATVSGTVADGSGHSWPLYAKITIDGYPNGPIYTNPYTGQYKVLLASGTYTVHVAPANPAVLSAPNDGYQQLDQQFTVGTANLTQNFHLSVDPTACTAPGYGWDGMSEQFAAFSGSTPQDGWSVSGTSQGWRFDDPANRPPPGTIHPGVPPHDTSTQGDSQFAIVDSAFYGKGGRQDTSLTSPTVDLSNQTSPHLVFDSGYYAASDRQENAQVDLSVDGGRSWESIWSQSTQNAVGKIDIPIAQAAGHSQVRVRFRFRGNNAWYWAIDNVFVGTHECVAVPGGIVSGVVTDGGSGAPVDGATVTSNDVPTDVGIAAATDDLLFPRGFYSLFAAVTGKREFTASATGYNTSSASVDVVPNEVTRQDWQLSAAETSTLPSSAKPVLTASAPAPRPLRAANSRASSLDRQPSGSTTVTLITGDRIRVTRLTDGTFSVVKMPTAERSADTGPLEISSMAGNTETPSVYALPAGASALVLGGRLDRSLFNIGKLIAAGDRKGRSARLPVVLQFARGTTMAQAADRAAGLPGVAVGATHPSQRTIRVNLDMHDAAAFWAALTHGRTPALLAPKVAGGKLSSTALADGITAIRLAAGQPTTNQQSSPSDQTNYTLTETINGPTNPGPSGEWCDPNGGITFCPNYSIVVGIAGAGEGQGYNFTSAICLDVNPCDEIQFTFNVPEGVYGLTAWGYTDLDSQTRWYQLESPQTIVAGDASAAFAIDDARQIEINTPHPSQTYDWTLGDSRGLPDGSSSANILLADSYGPSLWAMPTPRVTIGNFDMYSTLTRGQPPLTMTASQARQTLPLEPFYPLYTNAGGALFTRFSGQQTLPLVDGGDGSSTALHGADVSGKLVLIHLSDENTAGTGGCRVEQSTVTSAEQAGAAGVLVDPENLDGGFICPLPVLPESWSDGEPTLTIPYAAVPHSEADQLRRMLSQGQVKVSVDDNGETPYLYELSPHFQGQVPASPELSISGSQLAAINSMYHSDPSTINGVGDSITYSTFATNDYFVGGVETLLPPVPGNLQEYVQASPDLVQERQFENPSFDFRSENRVFARPGATLTDTYSEPPVAPGAPESPTDLFTAQPSRWDLTSPFGASSVCAFCRQGDTFYPLFYEVSGASPRQQDGPAAYSDPNSTHLYSNGSEVQPTMLDGFITYDLPPNDAHYQLTTDVGNTNTSWDFTSGVPATDEHHPPGTACFGSLLSFPDPGPACTATPLVLLRYDAGLSLNNTVSAPGTHHIEITGYHQDPFAPPITKMSVWTSTDGGKVWHQATVKRNGGGSYTASYTVPRLSTTAGTVSVKVEATDAGGDDVSQTIDDAFSTTSRVG